MSWRTWRANLFEAFEKPFPIMNRIYVDDHPFLTMYLFFLSTKAYKQYDAGMSHVLRTHITIPKTMTTKEAFWTAEVSMPIVPSI